MKHLLLLILPLLFKNIHACPDFTYRPCALINPNPIPVHDCLGTTYESGALIAADQASSEELCKKAVVNIEGFTHDYGRDFGRFAFKIYTTFDDPEKYNALRCQGIPRQFFVKKTGRNSYDVLYQAADMAGMDFDDTRK